MRIELPISKSIANRLLILQAIHGDGLMTVSCDMPDDVQILYRALQACEQQGDELLTLDIGNCGTAARFLTAYCAQREGKVVVLCGVERMHHRPIGQLVDALRSMGADIEYLGEEGYPPLRITGQVLDKSQLITLNQPQSTQFVSALLLIGANVQTNSNSPYISLTREMIRNKEQGTKNKDKLVTTDHTEVTNLGSLFLIPYSEIERDWSSAAFWYEYVALHGGKITLPGLSCDSLQGDKVVADIFSHLGVHTTYTAEGITISKDNNEDSLIQQHKQLNSTTIPLANTASGKEYNTTLIQDFSACPDLYPAVALTCERLGIELQATGVESLPLKESDRLRAVVEHRTDADHRMAMALLIAGYEVDDTACISKSYPQFLEQYRLLQENKITIVVPRRGINDEGKGKKHALYRLISAAKTEYVWMQDDDVIINNYELRIKNYNCDLLILPLRMESESEKPSLLERLQIAEYAAIQQLTIETAKRGHAVMCSGANLIVKRERWLESYQDLHPEIASGDDMFLLESFKRRGLKIAVLDDPRFEAIVRPHTEWRAFLKQRMRWAGKAPKYTDKDILQCGAIVLVANVLQLLCPLVLLVKFPIEYRLIKKRDASVSLFTAFVLGLIYPIYMLISLLGGMLRRQW